MNRLSLFTRAFTFRKRRWKGWNHLMITGKTPGGWRAQKWGGTVISASLKSSSPRQTSRSAGPVKSDELVVKLMSTPWPCWVTRSPGAELAEMWHIQATGPKSSWQKRKRATRNNSQEGALRTGRELQDGMPWGHEQIEERADNENKMRQLFLKRVRELQEADLRIS